MQNNDKRYVLAIGNSFSDDATRYLNDIAAADGVDLFVVNLCIGGCSLERHWNNIKNDARDYHYRVNGIITGIKVSILDALMSKEWDYITLQQASINSFDAKTYYPFIEDIAKYIKKIRPAAQFLIHQTWAYKVGNEHMIDRYENKHEKMFVDIKAAYERIAVRLGKKVNKDKTPLRIIPCGQALEYARANSIFDDTKEEFTNLFRDGKHLSLTHGRFMAAAVWFEVFSGKSIVTNKFKVAGVSNNEMKLLKDAAHRAAAEYGWETV